MSVYMGNCNVFNFHFEFINSYHIFLSVIKILLYNIFFFCVFFVKHIQQVLAYKNSLGFVYTFNKEYAELAEYEVSSLNKQPKPRLEYTG